MEYLKVFEEFNTEEYWMINSDEFAESAFIKISPNELNKIKDVSNTKGFEYQEKSVGDYNSIYLKKIRSHSDTYIKIYKDYDDYFHVSIDYQFRTGNTVSYYKADQIEGIIKLLKNIGGKSRIKKYGNSNT
jgi:hypothetical protein